MNGTVRADGTTFFVSGVFRDITPDMLKAHFTKYGEVLSYEPHFDAEGRSCGYGWLHFTSVPDQKISEEEHVMGESNIRIESIAPQPVHEVPQRAPTSPLSPIPPVPASPHHLDTHENNGAYGQHTAQQLQQKLPTNSDAPVLPKRRRMEPRGGMRADTFVPQPPPQQPSRDRFIQPPPQHLLSSITQQQEQVGSASPSVTNLAALPTKERWREPAPLQSQQHLAVRGRLSAMPPAPPPPPGPPPLQTPHPPPPPGPPPQQQPQLLTGAPNVAAFAPQLVAKPLPSQPTAPEHVFACIPVAMCPQQFLFSPFVLYAKLDTTRLDGLTFTTNPLLSQPQQLVQSVAPAPMSAPAATPHSVPQYLAPLGAPPPQHAIPQHYASTGVAHASSVATGPPPPPGPPPSTHHNAAQGRYHCSG